MSGPDFNLLLALDVLLEEGNVTRAARRLELSTSAMSRALERLRKTTGDPLLVRAGRGLVLTPRAAKLREQVHHVVGDAEAILRPTAGFDVSRLAQTFTLRNSEGFVETFGPEIIGRVFEAAPDVRLRFVQKLDRESRQLREAAVDLETGVVGPMTSPEVRMQTLFRDRFVGVVRVGHPLGTEQITASRYAQVRHIGISERGLRPIDDALQSLGFQREIATTVGGFASALALARQTDLIASVPERHTSGIRAGMLSFPLPFDVPNFSVSLLWHPRLDADPAHRWLRACVRAACESVLRHLQKC